VRLTTLSGPGLVHLRDAHPVAGLDQREPAGLGQHGREHGDDAERPVLQGLARQDVSERSRDRADLGDVGHEQFLLG
jgi:hypothetical protein